MRPRQKPIGANRLLVSPGGVAASFGKFHLGIRGRMVCYFNACEQTLERVILH